MVTGMNPGGHGLAGNRLVIREFDPDQHMGALEPVLSLIAKAGVPVLLAPTLGEVLAQHGKEYVAIGVGTTGNASGRYSGGSPLTAKISSISNPSLNMPLFLPPWSRRKK